MKALLRHTVLVLIVWLAASGVSFGTQVYLKDGGSIDARSVWRQGNKVYVNINRDIVADFAASEIDLRRTFPKSGTARHQVTHPAARAEPNPPEAKPVVQARPAIAATAQKPAVPSVPAPAPVAIEAPQPGAATATAAEHAAPPDKAEQQRRSQEAAKMMVEAVMKKDQELMKKALEMQKSALPQQGSAVPNKPAFPSFSLSTRLTIVVACLLIITGYWVVFRKAGQDGWKCLIPFYNIYVLMGIAGKPGWWMFLLFVPLVGVAILLFAMLSLAKKFGRSELFGVGLLLLPMIFFPLLAFGGSEYEG